MRNVSDKKIQNTRFVFNKYFPKFVPLQDYVGKYSGIKEAMDNNIIQHRKGAPCMLDNKGY
jgi:hypothetical protein